MTVSTPPNASIRSLPGNAVKLSSPGVPMTGAAGLSTLLTLILTTSVSLSGPPLPLLPWSFVVIVSVSVPKKSWLGAYTTLPAAPSAALICATDPVSVTVSVPLPTISTPPSAPTVKVPCATESDVVIAAAPASGSETARPAIASLWLASTSACPARCSPGRR